MSHSNTSSVHVNKKDVKQPTAYTPNSQNIFRTIKDKQNPYAQINRIPLNDGLLSWKAKGLLAYMMSLPDGWEVHISEITQHGRDGLDSVTSGFHELRKLGYIHRFSERVKGKFARWVTLVYEVPELNPQYNTKLVRPEPEKPIVVKPKMDNPKLVITEGIKTDLSNNYSGDTQVAPVNEKASVAGNYSEIKIKRNLMAMKRAKEIPQDTNIDEKVKEIFFHIQHRNISITPTSDHAYRAAIKLLKAGKWKPPMTMIEEETKAREQAAQREKLQEIKEGKGMLHQLIAQSALAPTFTPDAEKNISDLKNLLAGINANRTKEPLRARG